MKKRILLYGVSNKIPLREVFLSMMPCFEIIGISDINRINGQEIARELGLLYIEPEQIMNHEFDWVYVTTVTDIFPGIYRDLVHRICVPWNKVKHYKEFYNELHISCGPLNPNRTIYVFRMHPAKAGIVTLLVRFISQLIDLPKEYAIYVDLMNYTNAYVYGNKIGQDNAWSYWFEQPSSLTSEEVYNSKNVILCGCADSFLQNKLLWTDKDYRSMYNSLYSKYVTLNDQMKEVIEREECRIGFDPNNTCAVIYRGTDYTLLKTYGHSIQPTVEQMIQKIYELKDKWKFKKIYLSTEDAMAQAEFVNEFGNSLVYSDRELISKYPLSKSKKFGMFDQSALTNVTFNRENDSYYKGMEYLRQIIIASKCRYMISGNNGGYWGSLMMSPNGFDDKYIFDLGVYGIDDDSYATAWGHYVLVKEEKELEKKRLEENGYI